MKKVHLFLAALLSGAGCGPGLVEEDAHVLDIPDVPFQHPPVDSGTANDSKLRVYVVDEFRQEGIPCKLRIDGVFGTRSPRWGRTPDIGEWIDQGSWALGSDNYVFMGRGRLAIDLPPGRYRLSVTRGMEYGVLDLGMVDIRPGRGALVQGALRRVVDTEGEIAGEFHVHSAPSFDSDVPLDQRVLSLAAEGIEVFASTDHDALGDFSDAIAVLGLQNFIHWIPGDEITADGFGHFNVFPIPRDLDPARSLTHEDATVSAIIQRARSTVPGSVLQLNHPFWRQHPIGYWAVAGFDPTALRPPPELFSAFDAVEVWNGHTLDESETVSIPPERVFDAWMTTIQWGRAATATGNSDSHRLSFSPAGWPRTYVRVPNDDPGQVTDAMVQAGLLSGDASLTSGPFLRLTLEDGSRPGDTSRVFGREVRAHIDLQTAAWAPADRVEVLVNHTVVATLPVSPSRETVRRQQWDISVPVTRDGWILARSTSSRHIPSTHGVWARPMPSLALTNPIYFDADGDDRWTPPGEHRNP